MSRTYIVDRFEINPDDILGTGGFGQVLRSLDKNSGEVVAAKVIDTKRMRREKILQEIQLMERVGGHSGVVGLRGAQEVAELHQIFIFMELAQGGELFGLVIEKGKLEEEAAVRYFTEMVSAVGYLHEQGVVHRDLKLENVLLSGANTCKLCDFGLAHAYDLDPSGAIVRMPLKEVCGSKSYCAPEVLAGLGYDGGLADMWSLGICLFAMLAGFFPLDEAAAQDWRYARVQKAVRAGGSLTQGIFQLYSRPCPLTAEAIALIDHLLALVPEERCSAPAVLSSAWATATCLDEQQKAAVLQKGVINLAEPQQQPSFGSAMPSYESCGSCPSYGGASNGSGYSSGVVSFGAQPSMNMSFDMAGMSAAGGDGPVYRTAGTLPPLPMLTKQKAFGHEQLQPTLA
jgi:MAP/microtubule affinity-regulating kinase